VNAALPSVGIVLESLADHAATESSHDVAQAPLEEGLLVRWYMDALCKGSYPADVLEHLGADCTAIARETCS